MLRNFGLTVLTLFAMTMAISPSKSETVDFETGENLYKLCLGNLATTTGEMDNIAVSFYVVGIADFVAKAQQYGTLPMKICVPKNTTIKNMTETVCNYIVSRKGIGPTGQETGAELVGIGLVEAYRCR
jgi:hypothetical protein